jgi:hypothetical protein
MNSKFKCQNSNVKIDFGEPCLLIEKNKTKILNALTFSITFISY